MKLVIDISEEFYDGLFDESYDSIRNIPLEHIVLVRKIKNGKPLDDVLDEIMAEINELYSYVEFDENIKTSFNMVRLEEVQKVIDKYRAESEEEYADSD